MNKNAEAIIIFCSHIGATDAVKPLEPKEWSDLAAKLMELQLSPEQLLDFDLSDFSARLNYSPDEAARLMRLIDRSGSLRFELSKYEDMGIGIVTRADKDYPRQLRRKLGNKCPPLFYYAGDLDLLNRPAAAYVGSREVEPTDIDFTRQTIAKTVGNGYAVVSGGAKGIDSISAAAALAEGSMVVEYISDSMLRKLRDSALVGMMRDKRLLLMSAAIPTAGFNVGIAMMRNRFIYAQSEGAVVIRSDKGKGGTWTGAVDNLKKQWCPLYCRDHVYPGNQELIRLGAISINEAWDGKLDNRSPKWEKPEEKAEQISMFQLLGSANEDQ